MLQYCNNINNKNTGNEKVQDKNRNKANDVHSKKEKPGKEFLFPTVFSFPVIPSGGPEDRGRGICLCQQTSRLPLEVT